VRRLTGDYPGAAEALEAALGICRSLGDRESRLRYSSGSVRPRPAAWPPNSTPLRGRDLSSRAASRVDVIAASRPLQLRLPGLVLPDITQVKARRSRYDNGHPRLPDIDFDLRC
jgi:hypothetical protein